MANKRQRVEELVLHATSTLPDSISARRRILEGCVFALHRDSVIRAKISLMICTLDEHEKAQRELPLLFGKEEK